MTNLLTAAKAALEALETCDWNDNDFPDDTQYFDRFAVSEAATKLRAAIAEAEKQEPVAWIDGGDLRGVFNGNSVWVHAEDQGRMIPLYLHPAAPTVPEVAVDPMYPLLASAWFYGNWKAETYNERKMQELMEKAGWWPITEEQLLAAAPKPEDV